MKLRAINKAIGLVVFVILFFSYMYAATIGSNTAVTRLTALQTVNRNDLIGNATWLAGGFQLAAVNTGTSIMQSQFITSGPVNFNGLPLALNANFKLGDNTTNINTLGNIIGQGNAFELSQSVTIFPITATGAQYTFSDLKLLIDADTKLNNSALLFTGNSVIDGGGLVLDLAGTSSIIVGSNSSLLLRRITLNNVHGTMFRCLDNTGTVSFSSNVGLILDGDMSFTVGQLYVAEELILTGTHKFSYQSTQSVILSSDANVVLGFGLTFSYDPSNKAQGLFQFMPGSVITLAGATMHAASGGQQFLKANIVVEDRSYLSSEGTSTANAMIFGDGVNIANNVSVIARADLEILRGIVIDNDAR